MNLSLNTITETQLFLDRTATELATSFIHIEDFLSEDFKIALQAEINKFQDLKDAYYEDLDN